MGRFWNLRTKLVTVLVLVLSGTFLLQTAIHQHNEQQLLLELEKVAQDIANDTGDLIAEQTESQLARLHEVAGRGPRLSDSVTPLPRFQGKAVRLIMQHGPSASRSATGARVRAPGPHQRGAIDSERRVVFVQLDPEYTRSLARTFQRSLEQYTEDSRVPTGNDLFLEVLRAVREAGVAPAAPTAVRTGNPSPETCPNGTWPGGWYRTMNNRTCC